MALTGFGFVNCGSGATLDNVAAGTILMRAVANSASPSANSIAFFKGSSGHRTRVTTGGTFDFLVARAGTNLGITANLTSFGAWTAGANLVWAIAYNTAGVDGDQKLYLGTDTAPCAEPSAYTTQVVGTSTVSNDSADNLYIGNTYAASVGWDGTISCVAFFARTLTQSEIRRWQQNHAATVTLDDGSTATAVGYWILDNTTSITDQSGNGNTGTVTTATLASAAATAASDTGTVTDSLSGPAVTVSGSDSGTLTDAVSGPGVGVTGSDSAILAEQVSPSADAVASDAGTLADTALVAVLLSLTDAGTFSDGASVVTSGGGATQVSSSDTGTFSEGITILVVVVATDTALMSEQASIAATLAGLTDPFTAVDQASIAAQILDSDGGTFGESMGGLAAVLGLTDTGSWAESLALSITGGLAGSLDATAVILARLLGTPTVPVRIAGTPTLPVRLTGTPTLKV